MHPVVALEQFGGVARRSQLLRMCTRSDLDRVLEADDIIRDARGRYSLPATVEALRVANQLTGVLSHASAALHWGWAVLKRDAHDVSEPMPARPDVTMPRKRQVRREQRQGARIHYADLDADDVRDHVTSQERTLFDVMRGLPFAEALAIADSALREGDVTPAKLVAIASTVRGPGAAQARRVAACADGRAANPFESALRAIVLEFPELDMHPQGVITGDDHYGKHDLVDVEACLVVEADSHTWHTSRKKLRRDCRRYNWLVTHGWVLLRFTWEDVVLEPELARQAIRDYLASRDSNQGTGRVGRRTMARHSP